MSFMGNPQSEHDCMEVPSRIAELSACSDTLAAPAPMTPI
jgi:hypothetical protein